MKNWKYIEGAKTGNDTPWEYAHRKPKVINEDKTGAEEFFKQLSDDVKEREEKDDADIEKVGNGPDPAEAQRLVNLHNYQTLKAWAEENLKKLKPGDPEYERSKKLIAKYEEEIKKNSKVGNSSVSGGTFKSDDGSQKAVIDINPQSGTARVVWFENDRQNGSSDYRSVDLATAAVKRKGLKKVGNKKTGNQSPQERLNQDLSIIKEECRKKGTSLSFSELAKELEKYGWDFNELRKLKLPVSVGNSKIGNRVIEKESEMSQELKNLLKKAPEWIKEKIQYAFSHGFTIDEKDFINAIKKEVGNSASDDKFAYVMREFDAGKLKTPDGKVVTDPAQAKAIAYSESKKTENGLARARNAIKKS
jgi:hypothetical protein